MSKKKRKKQNGGLDPDESVREDSEKHQLFWLKKFCGRGDVRVDNIFPRDGDGNVRLSPHIWKQTME